MLSGALLWTGDLSEREDQSRIGALAALPDIDNTSARHSQGHARMDTGAGGVHQYGRWTGESVATDHREIRGAPPWFDHGGAVPIPYQVLRLFDDALALLRCERWELRLLQSLDRCLDQFAPFLVALSAFLASSDLDRFC